MYALGLPCQHTVSHPGVYAFLLLRRTSVANPARPKPQGPSPKPPETAYVTFAKAHARMPNRECCTYGARPAARAAIATWRRPTAFTILPTAACATGTA